MALSVSIARRGFSLARLLRLAISFGVFQGVMTVLGWLAGRTVVDFIAAFDHWLAFGLLLIIGGRMIWESFHDKDEHRAGTDVSRWPVLLTLSVATSIDALAVGLSFAFLKVNILMAGLTIGVTSFVVTIVGQLIGNRAGALVGKRAEAMGGVVLVAIGVRILLEHIL